MVLGTRRYHGIDLWLEIGVCYTQSTLGISLHRVKVVRPTYAPNQARNGLQSFLYPGIRSCSDKLDLYLIKPFSHAASKASKKKSRQGSPNPRRLYAETI